MSKFTVVACLHPLFRIDLLFYSVPLACFHDLRSRDLWRMDVGRDKRDNGCMSEEFRKGMQFFMIEVKESVGGFPPLRCKKQLSVFLFSVL